MGSTDPEGEGDRMVPRWLAEPEWQPYDAHGNLPARWAAVPAMAAHRSYEETRKILRVQSRRDRKTLFDLWSWFAAARFVRAEDPDLVPPAVHHHARAKAAGGAAADVRPRWMKAGERYAEESTAGRARRSADAAAEAAKVKAGNFGPWVMTLTVSPDGRQTKGPT